MKKERAGDAVNNYINNIYLSVPKFKIKKSIDFLTLSVTGISDPYFLRDFLVSIGYQSVRNYKLDKGNYQKKWSFNNPVDGVTFDVLYVCQSSYLPSMLFTIHDPNKEFVDHLYSFFCYHNINHNLSRVELTFDFFTDEVIKLREFLKAHLYEKYSRSKSRHLGSTFYTGDLRKSVRGMRVYSRPGWDHARMELTMKSQLLKNHKLFFPLSSIDSLDLSQFFKFMILDAEKLENYMIKFNQELIDEAEKRRSGYGQLVIRQIRSYISCIMSDYKGDNGDLMSTRENLKSKKYGVDNYSRFFAVLDDFNEEFFRQVSSQNFLKSRHETVIGVKRWRDSSRFSPNKCI